MILYKSLYNALKYGGWTSFTPSWTNLTVGSGTNSGKYCQIGKLVFVEVQFAYGAGSAVNNYAKFALPVSQFGDFVNSFDVLFLDNGTAWYKGGCIVSSSSAEIYCLASDGANVSLRAPDSSTPFTWAAGDSIVVNGFYEAA